MDDTINIFFRKDIMDDTKWWTLYGWHYMDDIIYMDDTIQRAPYGCHYIDDTIWMTLDDTT